MKNTVLMESKIRQKLKMACALLCIFCIMFIAFWVCVVMIDKQNLNGQVSEVTAVLDKVFESDSNVLTMQDGKEYNVVWSDDVEVDFNDYKGSAITLIVTQNTFGGSNPWIMGLKVNDKTIVDYHETLDYKTASNNEIKTAVIAITVILCVGTCGVFIWRFNIPPLVERELYHEFAEFLSQRQPTCPERKRLQIGLYVYLGIILVMTVLLVSFGAASESNDTPALIAIAIAFASVALIGGIALLVASAIVFRIEIDFYANKLPFDFSDISHIAIRKKYKEQLQQEMKDDREAHPDSYADGGNGYDVQFDEKGVTLKEPFDEEQSATPPTAEDVFDYADKRNDGVLGNASTNTGKTVLEFSYKELNLEAVAHYRKRIRPMMIIVKSRLSRTGDFPEEFVNDIHLPLDINLLNTLNKYRVQVENLEYLLNNSKQLMLENCFKNPKNRNKMTK